MNDVSELRKGIKIKYDGQPYSVTDFNFSKPGKGQAVYRCRLKNMLTGNTFDKSWRSADKFEKADISTKDYIYSYKDDQAYVFINEETYEQLTLDSKIIGNRSNFLMEEEKIEILFFEGNPIDLELPNFVEKEITKSDPGVRGDTATNVMKPAFIDNGYELQVPIFINEGDIVRIDTRTGQYSERVRKA